MTAGDNCLCFSLHLNRDSPADSNTARTVTTGRVDDPGATAVFMFCSTVDGKPKPCSDKTLRDALQTFSVVFRARRFAYAHEKHGENTTHDVTDIPMRLRRIFQE